MVILSFITETIRICLKVSIVMLVVLVVIAATENATVKQQFMPINQPGQVLTLMLIKLRKASTTSMAPMVMEHSIFAKCTHISLTVAKPDILKRLTIN